MTSTASTLLVAASVIALSVTVSSQRPVFKARADLVQIDVLVSDKGQPVRSLGREDFELRDNGVVQQLEFVSYDERPVNVIITLDLSRSVAGRVLDGLKSAAAGVMSALKRDDRAALVSFSQAVASHTPLTTSTDEITSALAAAEPMGETGLINAAFAAISLGEVEEGRTLALIFSDGVDTASWLTAEEVLDTAARSHVVVYGVTIGSGGSAFLRDLTARTGGRIVDARSSDDLRATFLKILDEYRHRHLLGYTPQGVAADGWHKVEVRLKGRSGTVRARPGYQRGAPGRKIASAARWPLTTALSMVPGRPVSIQSPAR